MTPMGEKYRRSLVGVIIVAVLLVGVVLWAVWQSPKRDDLSTYGAFAVALIGLAGSAVIAVAKFKPGKSGHGRTLDELADSLAQSVKKQWDDEARRRSLLEPILVRWKVSSRSAAGSISAAVESCQFPPLPGLQRTTKQQLMDGTVDDLHARY
jgi:hypothetical protein